MSCVYTAFSLEHIYCVHFVCMFASCLPTFFALAFCPLIARFFCSLFLLAQCIARCFAFPRHRFQDLRLRIGEMREVIEEANGLLIKFVKDQAEAIDKEEAEAKKASKKVQFECTLCIPNSGKKVGHTGPHKRKPGKRKASGSGMGNNENQCKKGKLEPTFNECTKCTPNSGKEAGHQGNHTGGKKKAAKKSGAFFM